MPDEYSLYIEGMLYCSASLQMKEFTLINDYVYLCEIKRLNCFRVGVGVA